jgi:hypothetical protein
MKAIHRFMPSLARIFASGALLILALILLAPNSLAAGPSQWGESWNYKLLGKLNSALNPDTGLKILITGSGSFDLSQSTINGGGSYTLLDAGGSVAGSGTWSATKFVKFDLAAPGQSPGEGGRLEFEASFAGTEVGVLNVVIQCSMWGPQVGPPFYPWPPDFVEVGPYTTHQTGAIMFNLNQ